jgi:hypothetical protein
VLLDNGWWSIAHHSYILHRNTTVSIFHVHIQDGQFVSAESTGLLPYDPGGAVALPATTAYVYAPVPPITAYRDL